MSKLISVVAAIMHSINRVSICILSKWRHIPLEKRYIFFFIKGDHFVPLFPNHGIVENGHDCDTRIVKLLKLVDQYGKWS